MASLMQIDSENQLFITQTIVIESCSLGTDLSDQQVHVDQDAPFQLVLFASIQPISL